MRHKTDCVCVECEDYRSKLAVAEKRIANQTKELGILQRTYDASEKEVSIMKSRIAELEALDVSVNQFGQNIRSDERRKTVEKIAEWLEHVADSKRYADAIRREFLKS